MRPTREAAGPSPRRIDPMSGIAVLYQWDGAPADRSTVERMLGVIPYRAVDGSGVWINGPIAIGHAKLATTPEALTETSPFVDDSSGLVLSMDGRVDNRDELIADLNSRGHQIRTGTDAEIVLRAWQCWGAEAPAKLIGDFAFALWDPSKRTLFCARDPLGVKAFLLLQRPRILSVRLGATSTVPGSAGPAKT